MNSNSDDNYEKLWDKNRVADCCKLLSKDAYKKIVVDFFEKNNRIDFLIEAINNEQISKITKECHSLKGASSMIGLIAFNDIIETIEKSFIKQSPLNKIEIIRTLNDLLTEAKNQFLKLT
uniref:Hpt domain-containing protein n=1 Tax=Polynucleobacter sp. TaxID=2029855 RepID=UPI0040479A18